MVERSGDTGTDYRKVGKGGARCSRAYGALTPREPVPVMGTDYCTGLRGPREIILQGLSILEHTGGWDLHHKGVHTPSILDTPQTS